MIDPQSYVGMSAERSWFDVFGKLEVGAVETKSAAGALKIEAASAGPLKMRLFPENLPAILDAAMADPKFLQDKRDQAVAVAAGVFNSVALDRLEIRGASQVALAGSAAGGRQERRFGSLTVSGLTAARLEEVAVSGLSVRDEAIGVTLGKLVLGRFTLPPPKVVAEANKALSAGETVDTLALAPTIGLIKLEQLDVAAGPTRLALGAGVFDLNYYLGGIPTDVRASLSNLKIPADAIQAPGLRKMLADFNYTDVDASAELVATWQESAAEIAVEKASITFAKAGSLTLSGALTNVPRSLLEKPSSFKERSASFGVRKLRLDYVDNSLADRLLDAMARENKQTPVAIKNALATNMPSIMSPIPDPAIRNRMTFTALAFVNDPKSLTISSTLNDAVPLADIIDALSTDAKRLPGLLKLDFSANRPR